MDVILTFSFKLTVEIEMTKRFVSYFADEGMSRRFLKHNYVLSFIHCHRMRLHCFLLLIAQLMRLDHL